MRQRVRQLFGIGASRRRTFQLRPGRSRSTGDDRGVRIFAFTADEGGRGRRVLLAHRADRRTDHRKHQDQEADCQRQVLGGLNGVLDHVRLLPQRQVVLGHRQRARELAVDHVHGVAALGVKAHGVLDQRVELDHLGFRQRLPGLAVATVVDHHGHRQAAHGTHCGAGTAHGLVDFVVGGGVAGARRIAVGRGAARVGSRRLLRLAIRAGRSRLRRRGRSRCGRQHARRGRRLVGQRARHATLGVGLVLRGFSSVRAAHGGVGRVLVRTVALGHLFSVVQIDVGRHLRTHVVFAHHGAEDGFDALDIALLDVAHVAQLRRVEARGVVLERRRQQAAGLVDHRHIGQRQVRHAARHQVANGLHLRAVEHAARIQLEQHRRAGLGLLAHEHRRLGHCQMHAGGLHLLHGLDGAGELAFQGALVIDLLGKLAGAEFLVLHQLEAGLAALGQPLRSELQTGFMHARLGHHDGGAAFGEAVRHVHLLQRSDDRPAVAVRHIAVQDTVVRSPAPQHRGGNDGHQRGTADHHQQTRRQTAERAQGAQRTCSSRFLARHRALAHRRHFHRTERVGDSNRIGCRWHPKSPD